MKNYAIILAAGKGERFKNEIPKQFTKLAGKLIIEHTISSFENHSEIDEIIVVTLPEYIQKVEELILKNNWKKVSKTLIGGKTRQESSFIGINSIQDEEANVLIHDAARPLISERVITEVINALKNNKAVDVAIPSYDTIIELNENKKYIKKIPKREFYWKGQTPQGFKLSTIKKAHELALRENFTQVTDDCGLVLHYKLSDVYVVEGEDINIKVTTPVDLYIADKLFQLKSFSLIKDIKNISLKDKVAVIFGASRGIGENIEKLLKEHKAKVYGFSRKKNNVDITNQNTVKNVLEEVYKKEERIDFVIVTAAILKKKSFTSFSYQEIIEQTNINYLGSLIVAKESFKYLKDSKGHLVLFTSSSYTRGRAFYSIYSSTKAAIVNFVQALSDEWSEYGIKVNAICPERTATPMRFENFGKEDPNSLLKPEKVAQETLKLLNTNITGQVIEVRK